MPHILRKEWECRGIGGADHLVLGSPLRTDALVPLPVQMGKDLARREQADGGVGRGPGGPPHHEYT